MIIFPAIDLHQGRCVRLRQGQLGAETSYSDAPVSVACRWASQSAEWLHVVNLDGAFERSSVNLRIAEQIAAAVDIPVQLGGGLRSLADIEQALRLGMERVILGTVAVQQPSVVAEAIEEFGAEQIVVSIDSHEGKVAVRGWQEVSEATALSLGQSMAARGVRRVVYTDIARDGMLVGINVEATRQLAEGTGLRVIASGGVASLEDIRAVLAIESSGVEGVIIGQALYSEAVSLPDALALARTSQAQGHQRVSPCPGSAHLD
jgi:phosphoribosylformimino-5-aminoimidazole carboxamide ribotide isomerase